MKAFTLIELLLTIALISIVSLGTYSIVDNNLIYSTEIDEAISVSHRAIKTAQINSMIYMNNSSWSIRFFPAGCTVYQGNDFDNRDQSLDNTFSLSSNISFTGDTDFQFVGITGETKDNYILNVHNRGNKDDSISINKYGQISD